VGAVLQRLSQKHRDPRGDEFAALLRSAR